MTDAEDFRVPAPPRDTADDDLVWLAIERIFDALATPYEPDPRLHRLTPGQRAVYALDWIRKEVGNGGFDQLLENSTGSLLPEAIEGADRIGADDYAALLRRAAAIFPNGDVPRDHEERADFLDRDPDRHAEVLDALDDEFFDLIDNPTRNLTSLLAVFIAANDNDFFLDGPS